MQGNLWATDSLKMCCLVEEVSTFEGSFPQTWNSGQFFFHHSECTALISSCWHGFWTEILCSVIVCVSVVVCLLVAPLKTSCLVYGWCPGVLWYELKKQPLHHLPLHSASFALWYPFLLKNSSNHFITYLPPNSTLLDPGIKDTHTHTKETGGFLWYLVSKK